MRNARTGTTGRLATKWAGAALGIGLLAGCSQFQDVPLVGGILSGQAFGGGRSDNTATAAASGATATPASTASPFNQQLAAEYAQFARFETQSMADRRDGGLFSRKAQQVNQGQTVLPEDPATRDIDQTAAAAELASERQALLGLLDQGGRSRAPFPAAVAQARYDCWVEQQEEGFQTNDIRACREMYREAVTDLRAALAPPPTPVAQPQGAPSYLVFFDFDRATLTPAAQETIREAAAALREGRVDQIRIVGHTDTVGPPDYNQRLSQARAEAVQAALRGEGIATDRIETTGTGENQLLVATNDGVREAANRRAEIAFR